MPETQPLPPPPPPNDWEDSEENLPELPDFLPPPAVGGKATEVESETPLPLPPFEEEEALECSVPFFPSRIPDDDVSELPPLPPLDSTERKKGTGISVALGIAAFFAAAMGFQNQSGNVQLKREIAELNSLIEQQTAQQEKYAAELRDIENGEQQINEANTRLKKQQEEYNSLTSEIALLQRYSRPRVLARDKGQLQDSIAVLQRQSAELDGLLEMYLPPSELPEDKLQKRDIYIRKFALLYNEAWNSRAWNIMGSLYADYVHHQLTGNNSASVHRVLQTLSTTRVAAPGELRFIGYNGLHVELLYKSWDESSELWFRENMTISEQGRIFRWNEEVIKGEQPSLSAGFRSVSVSPKE